VPDKLTASHIIGLLAAKHGDDVFVSECKTGRSTYGECPRLDAWAMRKSWTKPHTYGYEVKVDRGDFLRDDKWRKYLEYCSDFYFVCPHGLIAPNELPEEAGLMWASKTGTRLFTKKKAVSRIDTPIPEDIFRYILMWRCRITREHHGEDLTPAEWKQWALDRSEKSRVGQQVAVIVERMVAKRTGKVMVRNNELDAENKRLQAFKEIAERLGISLTQKWGFQRTVEEKLEAARSLFSKIVRSRIRDARVALEHVETEIEQMLSEEKDESVETE